MNDIDLNTLLDPVVYDPYYWIYDIVLNILLHNSIILLALAILLNMLLMLLDIIWYSIEHIIAGCAI